ncbi:hypothetical protein [Marinagarivorans algicola]|uniref:hypothetical protein n=1 Tax=Marinagarivorans algicola TaxID=1513270 RepID=UPI0006B97D0F|nr:hypothetical protein [Marinagarivorans algicola]
MLNPSSQKPSNYNKDLTFKHPSIELIHKTLQQKQKPKILDLGPPSAASFNFFRAKNCHIRFESLNDFFEQAAPHKEQWNSKTFITEMDSFLSPLNKNDEYDVILTWDLFCYLDRESIRYFCWRLAQNSKPNTLLQMVRYWGRAYPSKPCEFKILDHEYVNNNYASSELKHAQKLAPASQLQAHLPLFKLTHQFIDAPDMHPAMTESVFIFNRSTPQHPSKSNTQPIGMRSINTVKTKIKPAPTKSIRFGHVSYALDQLLLSGRTYQTLDTLATDHNKVGNAPLNILDLGAYNTNNSAYFKRLGHHAFFVNLTHLMQHINLNNTESLPSLLPLRPNQKFDVVLGWDLLCNYEPEQITKIIQLLKPHIHTNSLLHLMHFVGKLSGPNTQLSCDFKAVNKPVSPSDDEQPQNCQISLLEDNYPARSSINTKHKNYSIHELTCAINAAKIEKSFMFKKGMHPDINEYIIRIERQ